MCVKNIGAFAKSYNGLTLRYLLGVCNLESDSRKFIIALSNPTSWIRLGLLKMTLPSLSPDDNL